MIKTSTIAALYKKNDRNNLCSTILRIFFNSINFSSGRLYRNLGKKSVSLSVGALGDLPVQLLLYNASGLLKGLAKAALLCCVRQMDCLVSNLRLRPRVYRLNWRVACWLTSVSSFPADYSLVKSPSAMISFLSSNSSKDFDVKIIKRPPSLIRYQSG